MNVIQLIEACKERGLTIATAESLTGGLLCATLVDVPGASAVIRGAVVAYQVDIKAQELGVNADFLASHGPYNSRTAEEMAQGVRSKLNADIGISTTGVAGPLPEGDIPAGTFHVGVSFGENTVTKKVFSPGSRAEVRSAAVCAAIDLALQQILR